MELVFVVRDQEVGDWNLLRRAFNELAGPFRSRGGSVAEFQNEGEPCWGARLFCMIIQDTREHNEVKRPGYSFERPGRRVLRWIVHGYVLVDPQGNAASSRGVCRWSTDASADCSESSRGHSI